MKILFYRNFVVLEGKYIIYCFGQQSYNILNRSIMKIKLFFNPQALKNIKPTLQILYKLLQTQNPLPRVYFVYIIKSKNIRFLIDCQKSPIVISLGSQMLNSETACSFKQDKQMISILFENSQMFFQNLIHVLEKDDQFGLYFDIKKEILDGKQCKFLKLTFKNNDKFISRIAVETPKYDIADIKFHSWLCGCLEIDREAEFTIYLDQLLNMMKYMLKLKPVAGTKLWLEIDLNNKTYLSRSSDNQCLPNTQGEIKIATCSSSSKKKWIFQINISDLKVVLEMIRKSKELKLIISSLNKLIFVYMKEELFVCHCDMSQWIRSVNTESRLENTMKIQQIDYDEQERESQQYFKARRIR